MTAVRTTAGCEVTLVAPSFSNYGYYPILDRAPKGRDEGDQPMSWLRRHDEYHNQ